MHKRESPILVTGSHRSGTTWVGRTIAQHPEVRYIHEPFNVNYPNKTMGLRLDSWFVDAQSSNHKEEIIGSFNNLLQQSPMKYALLTCKAAGIDIKTPLRFGKHLAEFISRPRILVKDPIALTSAGWLHERYHFKVICMIRNPFAFIGSLKVAGWDYDFNDLRKQDELITGRLNQFSDSIESMCTKGNAHDFIDKAILLWNILNYVILKYQKQYPSWLFVKHEEISENPHHGFLEIFKYLGLEMNSHIENYIEEYTSKNNTIETNSVAFKPRNSKMLLQTWKDRLTNDEVSRVKASTFNIASQLYGDSV